MNSKLAAYLDTSNPNSYDRICNFQFTKIISLQKEKTEIESILAITLKQLFASGSAKIVE